MIFYISAPDVKIDFTKLNECCTTRLEYFIKYSKPQSKDDNMVNIQSKRSSETMIPGTNLDHIGHFMLRCLSLYNNSLKSFILTNELALFMQRWDNQCYKQTLMCMRQLFRDIQRIKKHSGFKTYGLLDVLESLSLHLKNESTFNHVLNECKEYCSSYNLKVSFQKCTTLIKKREVAITNGIAVIPCHKWKYFLEDLFKYHYRKGLSMITVHDLNILKSDERIIYLFNKLVKIYQEYSMKPMIPQYTLLEDVDKDCVSFPPCMKHLQQTLRATHRLSHNSRYTLSIFLKDIGMKYGDAIEFWKNEYSKVSTGCTSCKHSWQENSKKYTYSIKHMYGMVGSRYNRSISSCSNIQKKSINITDEGICPFSHFDENHLANLLQNTVPKNCVKSIIDLVKENQALEACKVYANFIISNLMPEGEITLNYETPVEYYHVVKNYKRE